jgi:hypothetical protein
MIKNLSQLKKALTAGADFEIVEHCRPECVGQRRRVNIANTSGFYSFIPDDPTNRVSTANCGKGSWLGWSKAPFWEIQDGEAALYDSDEHHTPEHLIIKIKVEEGAA